MAAADQHADERHAEDGVRRSNPAGIDEAAPMNETRSNLPTLGTAIRHEWALDWRFLTVNHGSFGATPLVVTKAQDAWRRRLEEQPSYFMRRVLPGALRQAATRLAEFIGAKCED